MNDTYLPVAALSINDAAQFCKSVCDNTMNIQRPPSVPEDGTLSSIREEPAGEFQNNMILSRHLSGPNKIYLNINAHRGVHYLEYYRITLQRSVTTPKICR